MTNINKLTQADSMNLYQKTIDTTKKNTESFDSVLEKETIIYATPASNVQQSGMNQYSSVNAPAELESYFTEAANQYGINVNLLKAVAKQESDFNPNITSHAGAMGIMQLMPDTAKSLGVNNPYDAQSSIMGGAKFLSQLLEKYNGDVSLALAAYNAGPGNVDKYNGIPPFQETQNYVQKILASLGNSSLDYQYANVSESNVVNTIYAVASSDATSAKTITIVAKPDTQA